MAFSILVFDEFIVNNFSFHYQPKMIHLQPNYYSNNKDQLQNTSIISSKFPSQAYNLILKAFL